MPNTYDLISTTTLTTAVAAFTVSLPSTYTDIQVRLSARSTRGTTIDAMELNFNGDSGSNYGRICAYNENGVNAGEIIKNSNSTGKQIGGAPAASLASNIFGQTTIDLLNYSGNARKIWYSYHSTQMTGGATRNVWRTTGNWSGTAPITSFTIRMGNGNVETGSAISIYGIKKA